MLKARPKVGHTGLACLQGQYPAAISHLEQVLKISKEMRDHVGDADAYGTIADIYTDMGDFDAAATCALSPNSKEPRTAYYSYEHA